MASRPDPGGPIVPCPACRKPAVFAPTNRWRPFCSERCKTGDLGAWASNAYVIEGAAPEEVENLVTRLAAAGEHRFTVYAPAWKGADEYDARATGLDVVRHRTSLMLPVPGVERGMRRLIEDNDIETVWFGAAAPLAL